MAIAVAARLTASVVPGGTPPDVEFRPGDIGSVPYRLPDGRVAQGSLTASGDFLRNPKAGTRVPGFPRAVAINDPTTGPDHFVTDVTEEVFEFRSGSLVPGRLKYPGRFVPTVGAKVISVDDYVPGADKPRVYNLPGTFAKLPPGAKRKPYAVVADSPRPVAPAADAWEYRHLPDRLVAVIRGNQVLVGRLADSGTFAEDRGIPPTKDDGRSQVTVRTPGAGVVKVPIINRPEDENEPVYEYRSEHLTPGNLSPTGEFVPRQGAVILRMYGVNADGYVHSEGEPRIYNLPGEFVRAGKK
ncbi:MAG: hypothetical protein K2X82_28450 [Gemmataceae bacterium]|nr:hypothetical protein [Gemmataceae bacterium]